MSSSIIPFVFFRNVCRIHKVQDQSKDENEVIEDEEDIPLSVLRCKIAKMGELNGISENAEVDSEATLSVHLESTPGTSGIDTSSLQNLKTPKIKNFLDTLTETEVENINSALARFFYGCNIPFSVIESDLFKDLLKILRPADNNPPTRKTLATTLLDKTHNECKEDSTKGISNNSVLLIDGWKNVAIMIHNAENGKSVFLDAWDISKEKETGEKLLEIVNQLKTLAKQLYDTNIYAVCSDNAANMKKMGMISGLWHVSCNSRTANLLAKEVVNKSLASVM